MLSIPLPKEADSTPRNCVWSAARQQVPFLFMLPAPDLINCPSGPEPTSQSKQMLLSWQMLNYGTLFPEAFLRSHLLASTFKGAANRLQLQRIRARLNVSLTPQKAEVSFTTAINGASYSFRLLCWNRLWNLLFIIFCVHHVCACVRVLAHHI